MASSRARHHLEGLDDLDIRPLGGSASHSTHARGRRAHAQRSGGLCPPLFLCPSCPCRCPAVVPGLAPRAECGRRSLSALSFFLGSLSAARAGRKADPDHTPDAPGGRALPRLLPDAPPAGSAGAPGALGRGPAPRNRSGGGGCGAGRPRTGLSTRPLGRGRESEERVTAARGGRGGRGSPVFFAP
jgi:hypothetical protein